MLSEEQVSELVPRLRRIEGQVRGILQMVEKRAYCISILEQASAATGALQAVARIILRNHIATCLREAVLSGDEKDIERKISELVHVFARFSRDGCPGTAERPVALSPGCCKQADRGEKSC